MDFLSPNFSSPTDTKKCATMVDRWMDEQTTDRLPFYRVRVRDSGIRKRAKHYWGRTIQEQGVRGQKVHGDEKPRDEKYRDEKFRDKES